MNTGDVTVKTKSIYGDAIGPFGFPMRSATAKIVDKALSKCPDGLRKHCTATINGETIEGYRRIHNDMKAQDLQAGERAEVSFITTASVDRDFEIVEPGGLDMSQLKKNPVVTMAHDYDSLPIGRAMWLKRNKDKNPKKDGWLAKTQYAEKPAGWSGDWWIDAIWGMVQAGYVKGKSIGFVPIDGHPPDESDVRSRPELASVHWIIAKALVIEYAIAPVQSNPDALVQAVAKGFRLPDDLCERLGIVIPDTRSLRDILADDSSNVADVLDDPKPSRITRSSLLRAMRRRL